MRPLIAVLTCNKPAYIEKATAQRQTWVPSAIENGFTVRFFVGATEEREHCDTVFLKCGDDYESLPYKTREMCRWALRNGFDRVCKVDDDTLIIAENLARVEQETRGFDLCGRFRMPTGSKPHCYPSGAAYLLSRRALEILSAAEIDAGECCEDRWAGNVLASAKAFRGDAKYDFRHLGSCSGFGMNPWQPPSVLGFASVLCEYTAEQMRATYALYLRWRIDRAKQVRKPKTRITPVYA